MMDVRAANDDETKDWAESYRDRVRIWFERFDCSPEWLEYQVDRKVNVPDGTTVHVFRLTDDSADVGFMALSTAASGPTISTVLTDLWIRPELRRRGLATSAREWAETWAATRSATMFVSVDQHDPAAAALFSSYEVRAQTMTKRVDVIDALPDGVEGRPMTDEEFATWRANSIREYADQISDSGMATHEEAMDRSRAQTDSMLPNGLRTPGYTFWTILADGVPVATNWLRHQYKSETSYVFAVETHEQARGKGYGRAAMVVGEAATRLAGDTYLALNVFGHNRVAMNLYDRLGYTTIEQVRSAVF